MVSILRPRRLQELIEARPTGAVNVQTTNNLLPECVAPESTQRELADNQAAAGFLIDVKKIEPMSIMR